MFKAVLFVTAFFYSLSAAGQGRTAIEVSLLSRYDRHSNYITNFAGRSYNDTLKLYGTSYGVGVQLRKPISPSLSVYAGVGYYRLGVNKIAARTRLNNRISNSTRSIHNEDDDSTRLGYSTSRYHYNNLSFTLGVNKLVALNGNAKLDVGLEGIGYWSFSQGYLVGNGHHYKTANGKPVEWGVNATIGLLKEYRNWYIRPALLIPVYQNLKGDRSFDESTKMNISKWFNGAGLIIRVGKYL